MAENIDIRNNEDIIKEIREKIKKNPKYINPCCKEFQEDIKRYKFESGNKFISWMQQNGIMKNPTKVRRDYIEEWAKNKEFGSYNEYRKTLNSQKGEYHNKYCREYHWSTGKCLPISANEDSGIFFGKCIGEELFKDFLLIIFENVKMKGYKDGGIDFVCSNPRKEFIDKYPYLKLEKNKEYGIQLKSRCLTDREGRIKYEFPILYNDKPDYYILSGWDNRESLQPMYIWMIKKDEAIRYGKGCVTKKIFWKREKFCITDRPKYIKEFRKYELKDELEKLKELRNKLKEDI